MIEDGKLACYNRGCKYYEDSPGSYDNGFCSRVEKGQAMAIGSRHIQLSIGDDIPVDVWVPVCIFYDSSKQTVKCLRCNNEFPREQLYTGICRKCMDETILQDHHGYPI